MDDGAKEYLGYLDKEMTIMGVLSAFPLAVVALVLDRCLGEEKHTMLEHLWNTGLPYGLAGIGALILASFFFYRQRSLLAWYYGQIALSLSRAGSAEGDTKDILTRTDGWSTWIYYRTGWGLTFLAVFYCLCVALSERLAECGAIARLGFLLFPGALCLAFLVLQGHVLNFANDEQEPWKAYWSSLQGKVRPPSK